MNNDEIYFFLEEKHKKAVVKQNEMKFAGAFSVHHTSEYHPESSSHLTIKKAKWVKGLC
jgi:hypothetical protein